MVTPTKAQIKKVMRDTGMEFLQAYHHLQDGSNPPESCQEGMSMEDWRSDNPPVHGCGHMQGRGAA